MVPCRSLILLVVLLSSALAHAAPDAGVSCAEVEQRLAQSIRALNACTDRGRASQAERDACNASLEETEQRAVNSGARVEACLAERDQQCQATARFAASLLSGSAVADDDCVSPEVHRRLQALLDAFGAVAKSLVQLEDYAMGVSDTLPRPTGSSDIERRLGRLTGGRSSAPLWNRRILIAAFKLTAPETWKALHLKGAVAIDAFLSAKTPFPEELTEEARGEHGGPPGPAGPPLTTALKLAVSYLELSACEGTNAAPECGRARQLVELLDSTGPLIVRRRVEDIWTAPCNDVTPDVVRGWVRDFPGSRREKEQSQLAELSTAVRSKLFLCYLSDPGKTVTYRSWSSSRLPPPGAIDARTLPLIDSFSTFVKDGSQLDLCGRAAKALQQLEAKGCGIKQPEALVTIAQWAAGARVADPGPELELCERVTGLLFSGATVTIAESFNHSPTLAEMVRVSRSESDTGVAQMRNACDERRGHGLEYEQQLVALAKVATQAGESLTASPWRLDPSGTRPAEASLFDEAQTFEGWAQAALSRHTECDALALSSARCEQCRNNGWKGAYDCDTAFSLQDRWSRHRRATLAFSASLLVLGLMVRWALRLLRARRTFVEPMRTVRQNFEGLGLAASPSALRFIFASRHDTLRVELPQTAAWERWGARACAVFSPDPSVLGEGDVNHAAVAAQRADARIVFLIHPDSAVPQLGAVRATLDWAARGGTRAVQVMPIAISRLAWAVRDEDLLDLVEETNLRGNPFELRGPVRSSSQFWNRERLLAGLLTESRSGNWVVVTGLRRFGKSSLALEVARRTPGPTAYVDLAGFHHEVSFGETPAVAVEAILRTLVMHLANSAKALYPAVDVPAPPKQSLDAPTLAVWLGELTKACGASSGTAPPPMLLVLDEVEQLLSAPPEKLGRALDVLATLTGRLRSAFVEPSAPHSGMTVGVMMCAAIHPLLWAPLATLGGQSVMGAFPSICVPALDDEAALAMMRGLGARRGIRFEDNALETLLAASHRVPLLLRRLGTSVLEIYDTELARQGALGAVRIGTEGAHEAIRREEQGGSPLRVWVESEIAQADTPAGTMLRVLARAERVPAKVLVENVSQQVLASFAASGLARHMAPAELTRRAQEAASVMVRLLAETRLVTVHGDLSAPDAYSLPDGALRRILRGAPQA